MYTWSARISLFVERGEGQGTLQLVLMATFDTTAKLDLILGVQKNFHIH